MSRVAKIFLKACCSSSNVTFQEICYLLEYVGFIERKQVGTSHKIYKHPDINHFQDAMMNVQDYHGKAKSYQVEKIIALINKYNLLNGK